MWTLYTCAGQRSMFWSMQAPQLQSSDLIAPITAHGHHHNCWCISQGQPLSSCSRSHNRSRTHTRKHTHMHTQSEIKAPSTRPQPHGHLPNQILSPHSSSLLLLPTCRLLLQRHHTYIKIKNLENLTYCFTNILDERLVTMAILKALRRNLIFRQTRKHRFSQALFTIPLSRCKICTLFSPGIKSDKVRRAGLRMFK